MKHSDPTRQVSILVFDEIEVLDLAGPFEVFSVASRVALRKGAASAPFEVAEQALAFLVLLDHLAHEQGALDGGAEFVSKCFVDGALARTHLEQSEAELLILEEQRLDYERVLPIDGQSAVAWYNKGLSYDSLGREDIAISCYDSTGDKVGFIRYKKSYQSSYFFCGTHATQTRHLIEFIPSLREHFQTPGHDSAGGDSVYIDVMWCPLCG